MIRVNVVKFVRRYVMLTAVLHPARLYAAAGVVDAAVLPLIVICLLFGMFFFFLNWWQFAVLLIGQAKG